MSSLRQLFTREFQLADLKIALGDLGIFAKARRLDVGRSISAVSVLFLILGALFTAYWIAGSALSALQLNYGARQDLLDVLRKRRITAGAALRHAGANAGDPFLSAPTETLAASELDGTIRRVAGDIDGTVISSHPVVDDGSPTEGNKIEIKAVIEGKIESLQALLFRLETGTPTVFIDELSLETKSESVDGGGAGANPDIHMAATFVAYWRPPSRSRAHQ